MALTFISRDEGKDFVNHINGNKKDNSSKNLEWCSYSENAKHAIKSGLKKSLRPVISERRGMGVWYPWLNLTESDGFRPPLVHACLSGKQKKHKGMKWEYC